MAGRTHDPNEDSDMTLDHRQYLQDQRHHPACPEMNPSWACSQNGFAPPGFRMPCERSRIANPSPLGLSSFAVTTFVLSCVNMHVRGETVPNIAIPLAFSYGGLVQLLAGMWEMAAGNTFAATALSSYGGFWIAYGILLTSPWDVLAEDGPYHGDTGSVMGFFLTAWWIFTTLLLICTLKSSVAFFFLFFATDVCFLLQACESYARDLGNETARDSLQQAAGFFGFLASFLAWYNALAGIQDSSNSFFQVPVFHFPWSDKGLEMRKEKAEHNLA